MVWQKKRGGLMRAGVALTAAMMMVTSLSLPGFTLRADAAEPDFYVSFESEETDYTLVGKAAEEDGVKNVTVKAGAPGKNWTGPSNLGWTGKRALSVSGEQTTKDRAHAYYTLYEGLDIKVADDTRLSYVIFPDYKGDKTEDYDYEYSSMYMSIDLKFTDGTYLRDLKVKDQNGVALSPQGQGRGRVLYTRQWNHVYADIGKAAKGKTIDSVLVCYDNPGVEKDVPFTFTSYFDDITISRETSPSYKHLSDYVNILRGTNDTTGFSRGLTAPVVTVPHGFNFWAPSTTGDRNKLYDYQPGQNLQLRHITISHEASYWIGDRGTYQFMANTNIDTPTRSNISSGSRGAGFSHENEVARAHYYSVTFDQDDRKAGGVTMEVTPTDHAAMLRFTFPESAEYRNIIFDSAHDDKTSFLEFSADGKSFSAYSAHTNNGGARIYVYGEFDVAGTGTVVRESSGSGMMQFPDGTRQVTMRVATSFISPEQAKHNLELEISKDDTFDTVLTRAQKIWDDALGVVEIEGATYDQRVTFYSCMYRLMAYPNLMSENTGTEKKPVWKYASPYERAGQNNEDAANPQIKEGRIYINNGFWDTYRTTWAAYSLLTPSVNTDLLNGLVQHFIDQDAIPRWIAPGGSPSMVGTSSDVIFADAIMRGQVFDYDNAYLSMLKNAAVVSKNLTNGGRQSLEVSNFLGYAPGGGGEGMSWSIESYINDAGIANMAKTLMEKVKDKNSKQYQDLYSEYEYYRNRSLHYTKLFNKEYGNFFVGKQADGKWAIPKSEFDPLAWGVCYTETNAWNMAFTAPHDAQGLINLYGGKENFVEKLNTFFTMSSEYHLGAFGGDIHEMKEQRENKMGQYEHNNQPSHHIAYMYLYAGRPDKTQETVRDILKRLYVGQSIGQGYPGDEDNGEMSAWYVLSALGLYPVNMGSGEFAIGSPLFQKATIHQENGKDIVINAPDNSDENIYVQSLKVNGRRYKKTYIDHADLAKGATLDFKMGAKPSKWGTGDNDVPTSLTQGDAEPNPMNDLLQDFTSLKEAPSGNLEETSVYASETSDRAKLFDNDSGSVASFKSNETSVYVSFPKEKYVKLYTLTSGVDVDRAPASFTLYGSNDGVEWKKLDERTNETFQWEKYTRPFAMEDGAYYRNYRLDIKSAGDEKLQISELEFLGYDEKPAKASPLQSPVFLICLIGGIVLAAAAAVIVLVVIGKKKKSKAQS